MLKIDDTTSKIAEIYAELYPVVYGTIYSKVNNTDTADDLTQEVFSRFLVQFDEIRSIRPWIFSTLKHVVYEHYRNKNKISKDVNISDFDNDISLTFVNGFKDTRIMINEAIENIKDETDKSIFDLIAIQNYTYEETAKMLGYNKTQIRYRYGVIANNILDFLRKKGIKNIEDIL